MKKILWGLLPLLFLIPIFLLAGNNSPKPPPEPHGPVVGYVQLLSESSWRDQVSASIAQAADQEGIQLITLECQRTMDSQIQAIRTLITYQVDAIVLSPVVMTGWDNVLGEAKAAGIPVILIERRIKTDLEGAIAAYIGSDYEMQGREAARFVTRFYGGQTQPVQIMELLGTVGSSTSSERSRGIRSAFYRSEKYDIFYSVSCDYMYSKARETVHIFLSNERRPDVILSYSDAMTYGAIEAIEQLGLQPGRDILLVSFDGEQQAIDLLAEGKINCIVESSPYLGEAVMETVRALETGSPVASEVLLPYQVFTGETDFDALGPRGY